MTMSEEEVENDDEMPWATAAREIIEFAAANIEFDEARGVIYLLSTDDSRGNTIQREFKSSEEVWRDLVQFGVTEWNNEVPWGQGPGFEADVEGYVRDVLDWNKLKAFFENGITPRGEEIVTAKELLLPRADLRAQIDALEVNEEMIRYLSRNPSLMREMAPRKFEELVAELYKDKGYEVLLTPKTRDGGLDIRAYRKDDIGTIIGLIECKRYGENRKISVDIVRALYGVLESEKANFGVIATTSRFTKDAQAFRDTAKYRIHFADYDNIVNWLNRYKLNS